jgi:hypothetical protein
VRPAQTGCLPWLTASIVQVAKKMAPPGQHIWPPKCCSDTCSIRLKLFGS